MIRLNFDPFSSSPKLTECLHKKKEVIEQMEVKLDTGIDRLVQNFRCKLGIYFYLPQTTVFGLLSMWVNVFRTLNCMIGQMKHILATEQKKTDFRPEDENNVMIQYTTVR